MLDRLLSEMRLAKDKTYCLVWKCWFLVHMWHVIELGLNSTKGSECDTALLLQQHARMKCHVLDGTEKATIVVLGEATIFDNGTRFDFRCFVRYTEILQRRFDRSGKCTNEFWFSSEWAHDCQVRCLL